MRRRFGTILLAALMLGALMVPAMAADVKVEEYNDEVKANYTLSPADSGLKLDVTIKDAEDQNLIVVLDKKVTKASDLNDSVKILYINQMAGTGGKAAFSGTNAIQPMESSDGNYYLYRSSTGKALEYVALFSAEPDVLLGDVNGDGNVTTVDSAMTLRFAAGLMTPSEKQFKAANVNHDTDITAVDAAMILRAGAGLLTLH